jgi:hypothetical protein
MRKSLKEWSFFLVTVALSIGVTAFMLINIGFYLVELRGISCVWVLFLVLKSFYVYGVWDEIGKSSSVMLLMLVVCFVLEMRGSFILFLLGCCCC